jgi:hypothetical protein
LARASPPPYTPGLDSARNAYNSGGWIDGERIPKQRLASVRLKRGPHARRDREAGRAIFGENPGDDDDF